MKTQPNRLNTGGRINREKKIRFRFNGREMEGYEGDTLASALLANNVHLVGRSFKYHRPRGIFSAGVEEQNALIQLGPDDVQTEPNLRATQHEIYENMVACSQNVTPTVDFDLQVLSDLFWRMLPAGFYYKTFMWPGALWKFYEKLIRHAAGMGKAPKGPDEARYDYRYEHCDVLVIGAGPAGLCAAREAAESGARVIIADEQAAPGGYLLNAGKNTSWLDDMVTAIRRSPQTKLLTRTTVFGAYNDNYYTMCERVTDHLPYTERPEHMPRQRLWHVRAGRVILATGAIERHLVFHQNDRPGIMLAGAARTYLNRYGVAAGQTPVILTNNNSAWQTAFDFADAGIAVKAIVDIRRKPPAELIKKADERNIEVLAGYSVTGTKGRRRIKSLDIQPIDDNGRLYAEESRSIECNLLCISGGWNPTVHILSQKKGRLRFDEELASFVPADKDHQGMVCVGACNGTMSLPEAIKEARQEGRLAAEATGFKPGMPDIPYLDTEDYGGLDVMPLWELQSGLKEKNVRAFVDMQNDVTTKDIKLALNEGYQSVEHVKRYTTTGMGTDQGKTGNVLALGIMAQTQGVNVPDIGFTTFRPPYSPVTFGTIAGRNIGDLYAPVRKTPMHFWHEKHGAVFEDVGQWKRPLYYRRENETIYEAIQREAKITRGSVGVFDASTLGKIDIQGPDAPEFLNRIYTNGWEKLAIGKCRYGFMLAEDGMVMDDGVTARIGEHHYHMTTTTGGAARVMAWLEEWHQTEWPELKLQMTSVTDQWAVASISGPNARKVVETLVDDIDISKAAMSFMSWQQARICGGIPARIFRISFSGESGFEINVPASYGLAMWEAVMKAGRKFSIMPYGTEVMHLLRAEKGFIIVGQDTDGTTTPHDLGMDWIVSKKKDFIGKRSLFRSDMLREDRKKLVGLKTQSPKIVLEEGAHVLEKNAGTEPPVPMLGHVTSSYFSPTLGCSIALALVKGGLSRENDVLVVDQGGNRVPVRVVKPVFYDPEGERLRE